MRLSEVQDSKYYAVYVCRVKTGSNIQYTAIRICGGWSNAKARKMVDAFRKECPSEWTIIEHTGQEQGLYWNHFSGKALKKLVDYME